MSERPRSTGELRSGISVAGVRSQGAAPSGEGGRHRNTFASGFCPRNSNIQNKFFDLRPKLKMIRGTLTSKRPLCGRGPFYLVQILQNRPRGEGGTCSQGGQALARGGTCS